MMYLSIALVAIALIGGACFVHWVEHLEKHHMHEAHVEALNLLTERLHEQQAAIDQLNQQVLNTARQAESAASRVEQAEQKMTALMLTRNQGRL